jgi:hypothetical protein
MMKGERTSLIYTRFTPLKNIFTFKKATAHDVIAMGSFVTDYTLELRKSTLINFRVKIYRVSQEITSVVLANILSVILNKKVYMYMCPIPNGTLYRRATRHVITRVAKCIDVDGGILRKFIILGKLYQLWHLNNKYRY